MNRRSVLKRVAAGMALATTAPAVTIAANVSKPVKAAKMAKTASGFVKNTFAKPYTAKQYFDDMQDAFPDAGATYRDDRLVQYTGWLPEYIRSRGIADPWGQFQKDWFDVLERKNLVRRITTTPEA